MRENTDRKNSEYGHFSRSVVSDTFKFYNDQCPDYFNEVSEVISVITRSSNKKIKVNFSKNKTRISKLI